MFQIGLSKKRVSALVLATMVFVTGCDRSATPTSDKLQASEHTVASHQRMAETLDLAAQQDFDDARRGLIAAASGDVVVSAAGEKMWVASDYDFLQGDAPATVNPSLWRQAKLNNIRGLFQVEEGIYQLRGFDLANLTLIKGDSGWIVVDPLTTIETVTAAMAFAEQQLGKITVSAIVFTHSHVDHFGGAVGILSAQDAAEKNIPIIAPEGFIAEATSENVMAGPTMMRRAASIYGSALEKSATGHVDSGLGKQVIFGSTSILQPNVVIDKGQVNLVVDGVDFEFYNMPSSEAPAEMTFYLPRWKAFCGAEVLSHTMHNVLTLRGAKVRDALLWSNYIGEAIDRLDQVEVFFNSHHWPTWGHERIITQMQQQQDMYRFTHDQTLRLANIGYTPREIAAALKLPKSLAGNFHLRGYYGTLSHNSRAVYQHYFGWYDGNPANLDPLPPLHAAEHYVEFMGGADAILSKAAAYQARGEYRWVAEVLNHVVFADPDNRAAKAMLADAYRQLGYQAESSLWRDIYLMGVDELENGPPKMRSVASSAAFLNEVPLLEFMKALSVKLDADKAEGEALVINIRFSDLDQNFVLQVRNSVLYYREAATDPKADASLTLTKSMFLGLVGGQVSVLDMIKSDALKVDGSVLRLITFFSLLGASNDSFNIVTP